MFVIWGTPRARAVCIFERVESCPMTDDGQTKALETTDGTSFFYRDLRR